MKKFLLSGLTLRNAPIPLTPQIILDIVYENNVECILEKSDKLNGWVVMTENAPRNSPIYGI